MKYLLHSYWFTVLPIAKTVPKSVVPTLAFSTTIERERLEYRLAAGGVRMPSPAG
jgi:hypothetical protein